MRTSDEIAELASALAKAQGAMSNAAKDRENPHFKSKYATLASLLDACRPALSANGLAFVQSPAIEDNDVVIITRIIHSSGQWIESELRGPVGKHDVQGIGSAITYMRRYSIAAIVGIAPDDDDDDGQAAVKSSPERQASTRTQTSQTRQESRPTAAVLPLAERRKEAIAHFAKIERLAQVEFLFGPSATWTEKDLDGLRAWSNLKPPPTFMESVKAHLEARGLMQEALEQFGPPDDKETEWVAADVATWIRQTHPVGGTNA